MGPWVKESPDYTQTNVAGISNRSENCFDGGSSWSLQQAFVYPGATSTLSATSASQFVISHTNQYCSEIQAELQTVEKNCIIRISCQRPELDADKFPLLPGRWTLQ